MNSNIGSTEKALVIIKPDGVAFHYNDIMSRLKKTGLTMLTYQISIVADKKLFEHYSKSDAWCEHKGRKIMRQLNGENSSLIPRWLYIKHGRDFVNRLVNYLASDYIVPMVWQGNDAIFILRNLIGSTDPSQAEKGTIRGDLGSDSFILADAQNRAVYNLIHCSDSREEATREISIWFPEIIPRKV